MHQKRECADDKIVYCRCPSCGTLREKKNHKYTIIKRGFERNGFARFFCTNCRKWFNEVTGDSMRWQGRF